MPKTLNLEAPAFALLPCALSPAKAYLRQGDLGCQLQKSTCTNPSLLKRLLVETQEELNHQTSARAGMGAAPSLQQQEFISLC